MSGPRRTTSRLPTRTAGARRRRPARSSSDEQPPRRRDPAGVVWARPSRRARLTAALLSVALAGVVLALMSTAWRRGAPPPRPILVEARLIATPTPDPAPHEATPLPAPR